MAKRRSTRKDTPTQRSLNWEIIDPLEGLSSAAQRHLVAVVAELLVEAVELARSGDEIEEKSDE